MNLRFIVVNVHGSKSKARINVNHIVSYGHHVNIEDCSYIETLQTNDGEECGIWCVDESPAQIDDMIIALARGF